jgi:hypothetical protein
MSLRGGNGVRNPASSESVHETGEPKFKVAHLRPASAWSFSVMAVGEAGARSPPAIGEWRWVRRARWDDVMRAMQRAAYRLPRHATYHAMAGLGRLFGLERVGLGRNECIRARAC